MNTRSVQDINSCSHYFLPCPFLLDAPRLFTGRVCFHKQEKNSTYQTSARHWPIDTFNHPDCVKVDGFDYMNLQGNVLTKIAEDCGYTDILRLPWQTVKFKINVMCLTLCSSS